MKTKILQYLLDANDYVSGQEISNNLEVSRTAIWKHIKSLREDGYEIKSVTNKGYKLILEPDLLNESQLQYGLKTYTIGKNIIHFKEIDSTNEELKRQAKTNAPDGLVCTAETQTKGKGRLSREWVSEYSKGIYASILLKPQISPMEVMSITLISGLAICNSIKKVTGLDATIKWPNDVLVNNKKVCGILTEMSAQTDIVDYIIIGVGINVNNTIFPDELKSKATSLFLESGKNVSRVELLKEVLYQIEIATTEFITDCTYNLLKTYKENCVTIGKTVTVIRKDKEITGIAVDLSENGALIIETEQGQKMEINSGEVTVQGIY